MNDFRFEVRGSMDAILRDLDELQMSVVPAAASSALNKVVAQAKTAAAKEIAEAKQLPVKTVRNRLFIQKSSVRTLVARLTARLSGVAAHLAAGRGKRPRQTAGGAGVGRHFWPGAFVARARGAGLTVFKRVGQRRLPIEIQLIELEPEASRIIARTISEKIAAKWDAIFTHELKFRLQRKGWL